MDRDEMIKRSWKAYEEIEYKQARMNRSMLCLLVSVDFDDECLTLQPLLGEEYTNKDFVADIKFCSIPRKKMQAAIVNGEKIKKEIPKFEGSTEHKNPNYKVINEEDFDNAS
jgi:hypothetical protein